MLENLIMHDAKEDVISFCAKALGDQDFFSEYPAIKNQRRALYDAKLLMRTAKIDKRVFVRCVEWGLQTPYGPRSLALSPVIKHNFFSILLEKDEEIVPGTRVFIVSEIKMSGYYRDSEGNETFTFPENEDATYASYVEEDGVLKIRLLPSETLEIMKIEKRVKEAIALAASINKDAVGDKTLSDLGLKESRLILIRSFIEEWFDVDLCPLWDDTSTSIAESVYELVKNKSV